MIRGAVYNPNASVEERAINRETALRHTEYIAANYFDSPGEAKAFLDGVNRFAENDILREKGYTVIDGADIAPFRSYINPADGSIGWSAYATKYGKSDIREIFANPYERQLFFNSLSANQKKWSEEIIKAFENNEKAVADIINTVKSTLDETDVADSLRRLILSPLSRHKIIFSNDLFCLQLKPQIIYVTIVMLMRRIGQRWRATRAAM